MALDLVCKKKKKNPLQNITCNDRHQDSVLVTRSWNHLRPESVFRIQRLRKIWGPKGKENEITKHVTWPWGRGGGEDAVVSGVCLPDGGYLLGNLCPEALTWESSAQNAPNLSSFPKLRIPDTDQPGFTRVLIPSGVPRSQLWRHSAFNVKNTSKHLKDLAMAQMSTKNQDQCIGVISL